ncbi:hypothetical protein [Streptococcus sanguinis]|uniref:Uncharacterized protein n=1 Tax=Streptococcus sanguinis TaxID=1305 RepID=A0A3R9GPN9_STRSA|nr:hypothetical protein [Streptococcus sanguinis]RKV76728.1 MAG: hypothetical protein D8H99_53260 [Streptococcus sp.]RSI10612.1 hypothetical protein D8887_06400 [Streptococcus sanguinis]RSI29491.1 hypothetical protein D8877_09895 [Streptococcus sanguinis]
MIGEFSIMDWITLGGILTAVAGVLGGAAALWNIIRDNKALSKDHESLSKGQEVLSNKISKIHDSLSKRLLKSHDSLSKELSKEHQSIKEDTKYISDEMKYEKMARESLYKNSSRAKEILETMDMMKEVILQNAQLNAEVSELKVKNQELSQARKEATDSKKLLSAINGFERKLALVEEYGEYGETEEIRYILRKIAKDLSEFTS